MIGEIPRVFLLDWKGINEKSQESLNCTEGLHVCLQMS